jgi:hypothetical protein
MRPIIARIATALLILACCLPLQATDCLTAEDPYLDWTNQEPALPGTQRGMEVRTWTYQGRDYLLLNTGNRIYRLRIAASGKPVVAARITLACSSVGCPLLIGADYDQWAPRFATCDGCEFGFLCSRSGTAAFGLPNLNTKHLIESSIEGAFTFRRGSVQYVVATGWPGLCGAGTGQLRPALLRMTSLTSWEHLQCLDGGSGTPQRPEFAPLEQLPLPAGHEAPPPPDVERGRLPLEPLGSTETAAAAEGSTAGGAYVVTAGVDLGTHVLLLEPYGTGNVYTVIGSGDGLRLTYASTPLQALWKWGPGIAYDSSTDTLLTSLKTANTIYDMSNPPAPVPISTLPSDLQGSVALGDGRAVVCDLRDCSTYDVTDLAHPVEIGADWWLPLRPDPPPEYPPWFSYRWQAHMGVTILDGVVHFADYSVSWPLLSDLEACSEPAGLIFRDGFETGDTLGWAGWAGRQPYGVVRHIEE